MSLFYASVKPSQLVLMVTAAAAAKKGKLISINYLFVAEVAQWWNISWKWFEVLDEPGWQTKERST